VRGNPVNSGVEMGHVRRSEFDGRQTTISGRPSAKTWFQTKMRTDFRKPVGQNGSSLTKASISNGSLAFTIQRPPAPSPSNAVNGPAACIFNAFRSRNARCSGMCLRRRSMLVSVLSSNRTTNFTDASNQRSQRTMAPHYCRLKAKTCSTRLQ